MNLHALVLIEGILLGAGITLRIIRKVLKHENHK
jgi:hypothetical protein